MTKRLSAPLVGVVTALTRLGLPAVALMFATLVPTPSALAGGLGSAHERLIVIFKHGAATRGRAEIARLGGRIAVDLQEVDAAAVELPRVAAARLRASKNVMLVEPDYDQYMFSLTSPSGPPYQPGQLVPYGIAMVQADQVPDDNAGNRTLCIIDSGYQISHEDLSGNTSISGEDLTGSGVGAWYTDEDGHGTHVGGTVSAIDQANIGVVGVMPHATINLRIEKVFGAGDSAKSSIIDKAMLACRKAGANVISMSLGGSYASKLQGIIARYLARRNILMVAAAGNSGDTSISYPAGFPEVMSVAAVDENMAWASFSQYNADVEISGPGVNVYSTVPMGTGREASLTVDTVDYDVNGMDGSPIATVSAPLYDFGTGESADPDVNGKVCLILRGNITFAEKVTQCEDSGGVAAVIYNNVPGIFSGTLNGAVTDIPSMSASQEDGTAMLAQLGQTANAAVAATNYAFFSGTSMATPHVSAVATLIWSNHPNCTAWQIRRTLRNSALDIGVSGRDDKTGYGLVQAKAADDRITNQGCRN